jgi:hypothetical protein
MQRFFHVDREWTKLRPGFNLILKPFRSGDRAEDVAYLNEVYPNGVSRFGATFLSGLVPPHLQVLVERELICEHIRSQSYPERPSRFASVFACENEADARSLMANFKSPDAVIWEVECHLSFACDMHLLQVASLDEMPDSAHRYWRGEVSKTPFMEHLLTPPVRVIRAIG